MKLDATDIRYISAQEFRVLTAVEMGSKNHEVVPSSLIAQISGLHHSGINKIMGALAKRNLIARVQNTVYDGYRLTYGGYDYLAIRTFTKRDSISAVGRQIGVGKESDIYVVSSPEGEERIMKIHRLGRISFRNVKEKRDYMGKRKSASWMYMSRLAAAKEYAFMQILHAHGFPVPEPIDQARHCIIMSLIDAFPLRQIAVLPPKQIPILYSALMKLIVRLARAGLIHGDFNEFNLLIKEIKNEGSEGTESEDRPQVEEKGPRGRAAQASMKDVAEKMKEPAPVSESLVVGQGERIERGKGFERVIKEATAGETENDSESEEEEEDDDDEDDDEDDATEEGEGVEDDGDGQIYVEDGVRVEPVLIDFPQMVSVEHENAEYYFDRDVECVRRFFRKRFRFHSDEYPRFRDVVPVDRRQKLRQRPAGEADGSLQAPESSIDLDQPEVVDDGLGEFLDLDVLAKASGFGGSTKEDKDLETLMSGMRVEKDEAKHSDEDSSEEGHSSEEEEEEEEEEDTEGSGKEGESEAEVEERPRRAQKPSRGAAAKAAADGDDRLVAQLVALDRARAARKAEKHHGRKSQAGKAGRAHAGGKAKTGKARVIKDSMNF